MTTWFSIAIAPGAGSLAAVATALADARIAIEGIVGSPESGDGVVHLAVAEDLLEKALTALRAIGVSVQIDQDSGTEPSDADALIGAILHGPRS